MSNKVKKMFKTHQEYKNAIDDYKNELRDFFKDITSIYNLSAEIVSCNKIHVHFTCDVSLDSNHIIDFCEKFGFNKTIWMDKIDDGYMETFSYKFCKNVSSREVI